MPHQTDKPGILLVIAERGKPHLPIQAWLVRSNPGRTALHVSGLITERVLAPLGAVVRSLNNDFRTACGHTGEQAVGVDHLERRDQILDGAQRPGAHSQEGLQQLCAADRPDKNDERDSDIPLNTTGSFHGEKAAGVFGEAGREHSLPEGIVDQKNTKSESQPVEKRVVASDEDQNLERGYGSRGYSAEAASGKNEKWRP